MKAKKANFSVVKIQKNPKRKRENQVDRIELASWINVEGEKENRAILIAHQTRWILFHEDQSRIEFDGLKSKKKGNARAIEDRRDVLST